MRYPEIHVEQMVPSRGIGAYLVRVLRASQLEVDHQQ